jgi:hypothetical protein
LTENIPGKGSLMTRRWRCSPATIPPLQKRFLVEAA